MLHQNLDLQAPAIFTDRPQIRLRCRLLKHTLVYRWKTRSLLIPISSLPNNGSTPRRVTSVPNVYRNRCGFMFSTPEIAPQLLYHLVQSLITQPLPYTPGILCQKHWTLWQWLKPLPCNRRHYFLAAASVHQ